MDTLVGELAQRMSAMDKMKGQARVTMGGVDEGQLGYIRLLQRRERSLRYRRAVYRSVGLAFFLYGLWLAWPPLAWITAGEILLEFRKKLAGAWDAARNEVESKARKAAA